MSAYDFTQEGVVGRHGTSKNISSDLSCGGTTKNPIVREETKILKPAGGSKIYTRNRITIIHSHFDYVYIGRIFLSLHRKMSFFVIGNSQTFLYNNLP